MCVTALASKSETQEKLPVLLHVLLVLHMSKGLVRDPLEAEIDTFKILVSHAVLMIRHNEVNE